MTGRNILTTSLVALAACVAVSLVASADAQDASRRYVEEGRASTTLWSGYWWPTAGGEVLQPLEKYDRLTGSNSVGWEKANRPARLPDGSLPPAWEGLCHGQAASSVMEQEPTRALVARQGRSRETLTVGDQKCWLAIAHSGDVANFYGRRCNDENDRASKDDLSPEELWKTLRAYLKEQRAPLVLDLEPGVQVWNYPVYAYRTTHWIKRNDPNRFEGTIEVWLADNSVPPNFVGLKRAYKKYTFEIERDGEYAVFGTGKWTGESAQSHPDFAWAPFVVRSGNPELSYEQVCKLLGRTARPTRPAPRPDDVPNVARDDANENNENNESNENNERSEASEDDEARETRNNLDEIWFDLNELRDLIGNAKSSFRFDVSLKGLNPMVRQGELVETICSTDEDGYLYLFAVDQDDSYYVLYPNDSDDNFLKAKSVVELPDPNGAYTWRFDKPGQYKLVGLISERRLNFSGSIESSVKAAVESERTVLNLSDLLVSSTPSDSNASNEKGIDAPETIEDTIAKLGKYSFDVAPFYVSPK